MGHHTPSSWRCLARLSVLSLLVACRAALGADPAPVAASAFDSRTWVLFASPNCDDCQWTREEFLPSLTPDSAAHLPPVLYANIDTDAGYELLLEVERALGASGQAWPVLLAGDRLFYGREALDQGRHDLMAMLATAARQAKTLPLLAARADSLIPLDAVESAHAAAPPTPVPAAAGGGFVTRDRYREADVLYFESTGCKKCARVERQLSHLMPRFPELTIARINTGNSDARVLQMAAAAGLKLSLGDAVRTPMLLTGATALFGEALTDERIEQLFAETRAQPPFWQAWDEKAEFARAQRALFDLGGTFTLTAIIGAGLIDGINPCAFAVIVFLVSYLTLSRGLPRRQGLAYGLMFCLGVFTCYLLIGLGFSQLLELFHRWQGMQRWIYLSTGAICLLFVLGAVYDIYRAVRYGPGHMAFVTPKRMTNLAHKLIRQNVGRGVLVAGAFVVGFIVSSLELVCTGQMYLPVIAFINSSGGGSRGLGLLLIYNVAFVVPLLIVLGIGVYGAGSKRLAEWGGRHTVAMRAASGAVILGLAVLMFVLAGRAGR